MTRIKWRILVLIGLIGFHFSAFSFHFEVSPRSALPELSVGKLLYRTGVMNAFSRKYLLYLGDRFFFLHHDTESTHLKVALTGGVYMQLNQDGSRFLYETEDGYFGLLIEWGGEWWGIGAEFNHLSAHLGDGFFDGTEVILVPLRVNQNYLSLKLALIPLENLHFEAKGNYFLKDTPEDRDFSIEIGGAWTFLTYLTLEAFIEFESGPFAIDFFRAKLSANLFDTAPRLSIFLLFHTGKHYVSQLRRKPSDKITQAHIGFEFEL